LRQPAEALVTLALETGIVEQAGDEMFVLDLEIGDEAGRFTAIAGIVRSWIVSISDASRGPLASQLMLGKTK
jgi:hypothetical protein